MSQINSEIGYGSTVQISMNDVRVRSLAGDGNTVGSGTNWGLGSIMGRSFFKYSNSYTFYKSSGAWYYNGAYIGASTATSYTFGSYTYFRGAYQQTITEYQGTGENQTSINYDHYSVARA